MLYIYIYIYTGKSAGSKRRVLGKMKKGMKIIAPKKASVLKTAMIKKKFDGGKLIAIEQELATKSNSQSASMFKILKPKVQENTANLKNDTGRSFNKVL